MDTNRLQMVREIAESGVPGVSMSLAELRDLFKVLEDIDDIIETFRGHEEHCDCGGAHCPGVVVVNENGHVLIVPTMAAIARLREMTPMEFVNGEIQRHHQAVERAIELFAQIDDTNDDDELEKIFEQEKNEDPAVRALLSKIRGDMFRREMSETLRDIAEQVIDQLDEIQ